MHEPNAEADLQIRLEENMMAITRFDPFREFATLQDRMNRLFGDVYLGTRT